MPQATVPFIDTICDFQLLDNQQLQEIDRSQADPRTIAKDLIAKGWLTDQGQTADAWRATQGTRRQG
jgi:hypothetical protein